MYIKDEGLNPTASFKARGLSAAVTVAKALGARTLALPTAGNAGGAAAAYAAKAGLGCVIAMPSDTPAANIIESRAFGADVRLIDGLISDCGKFIAEHAAKEGWFEVSTLKEPYRIEGKKTMGYELWEEFGGTLPDVIVYPTGGGVGLIGMWKAFEELEAMWLIGPERPRMISAQAAGCAPIVRAFEQHSESSEFFENAATIASGLRVPKPLGDFLILAGSLRERRRRGRRHRRGNARRVPRHGRTGRHFRGARGGRRTCRDREAGEGEKNSARREGGAVQHRQRLQIPRGMAVALWRTEMKTLLALAALLQTAATLPR